MLLHCLGVFRIVNAHVTPGGLRAGFSPVPTAPTLQSDRLLRSEAKCRHPWERMEVLKKYRDLTLKE